MRSLGLQVAVEFSIFAEWQQNLTIGQENILCNAKTVPLN
jgi:hypothetical protein